MKLVTKTSKYKKIFDEVKQIIDEVKTDPKMVSASRFMGYRPSEERIKKILKEIIDEHEIIRIELDINREWINYWHRSSASFQSSEDTAEAEA